MKSVILFRKSLEEENEFDTCKQYLNTVKYRSEIKPDSLVIGRYSVLPFYKELDEEISLNGSRLINSYEQHQFIADAEKWANGPLNGITPKVYSEWGSVPEGKYIVKGRTNSRKSNWKTHMFASSKSEIPAIAARLMDDYMLAEQGLIVRPYIPLKQFEVGLNNLPITNEWRTFWMVNPSKEVRLLASGFYWASYPDVEKEARLDKDGLMFASSAAKIISEYANFFVIDIAETADGDWIVIEVNDGQMSGLSMVDSDELYSRMRIIF